MITKEAATALLLDSYRRYKRNCPASYRKFGRTGRYFFAGARGWVLLPATMTVERAAYPKSTRGAKR